MSLLLCAEVMQPSQHDVIVQAELGHATWYNVGGTPPESFSILKSCHRGSSSTAAVAGEISLFFVKEFALEDRQFILNFPLLMRHSFRDGIHIIDNHDYGLMVFEESESEARSSLSKQFSMLWDDIAQEGVSPLAPSAKALGERLRYAVKEVRDVGGEEG